MAAEEEESVRNLPEDLRARVLRDWNKEFQEAYDVKLQTVEEVEQASANLNKLFHEFAKTAREVAEIIIREHALPPEQRTVKQVGSEEKCGFAGGVKYR